MVCFPPNFHFFKKKKSRHSVSALATGSRESFSTSRYKGGGRGIEEEGWWWLFCRFGDLYTFTFGICKHTRGSPKWQPRGQNFWPLGRGIIKIVSGRGRAGYGQNTGKKSLSRFFHKNIKESKLFHFFPFFIKKSFKCLMFLLNQGVGIEPWKILFLHYLGGQRLPLGGVCVLEAGSANGNLPLPPPLAHVCLQASRTARNRIFFPPLSTSCFHCTFFEHRFLTYLTHFAEVFIHRIILVKKITKYFAARSYGFFLL